MKQAMLRLTPKKILLVVISLFGVVGLIAALTSLAATVTNIEAETGTRAGNTLLVADTSASGSSAVQFGTPPATGGESATPLCNGMSNWSSASTWAGGGVPTLNASVTLPANSQIQVDVDTPHFTNVTVPATSTLCFPDRATVFSSKQIVVYGKLQAGTPDKRLTSQVTFKLEGGASTESFIPTGQAATEIAAYNSSNASKCSNFGCINVGTGNLVTNFLTAFNGGSIEVYGKDSGRTWTDLASTTAAGSKVLNLRQAVTWEAGDVLTITSSQIDWRQAERGTVQSVSSDGKTVTLVSPLTYKHAAVQTCQTLNSETRCVDERSEVGLLSHNIKFTGPDNAADTKFSGQVIVLPGGKINVSNAEFFALGQVGKIARYPLHFHILGNSGSQSSVDSISLHDNFNRQIDIHGTNNLRISNSVASNTFGHSLMFEDGTETKNVVTNNLITGSTRNPDSAQRIRPTEDIPSNYWIASPTNDLTGNHSGGSDGIGFWHDLGPVDNFNGWISPYQEWGLFNDNVSHSNVSPAGQGHVTAAHDNANGFFVSEFYASSIRASAYRNSAWKNEGFNFWVDGPIDFTDTTGAGSCVSTTLQNSYMRGGFQVGETANSTGDSGFNYGEGCGLLRQYHGSADYDNIWVSGYGGTAKTVQGGAITDGGVGISDHTTRVRNIKFFGSGFKVFFQSCKGFSPTPTLYGICYYGLEHGGNSHVVYDLDGSIRGDGVPIAVTNSSPFMRYGQNFLYKDFSDPIWGQASRGLITPVEYKYFALTPQSGNISTLTRVSDGARDSEGAWTMLKTSERYAVSGQSMGSWRIESNYAGWVEFVMDLAQAPSRVEQSYYSSFGNATTRPKASSLANLGVDGVWWWESGKLYVRSSVGGTDVPFGKAGDKSSLDLGAGEFWRYV